MEFSENDHKELFADITQEGFHIFNRRCAEIFLDKPETLPRLLKGEQHRHDGDGAGRQVL